MRNGDCNDNDVAINPGAADGCPIVDGIDNDCDSVVDNGVENIFTDNDGDGFGSASIVGCPGSPNTSLESGDCNDANADVNPGAVEIACDGIDNDCNSQTNDIVNTGVAYPDADNDTYGSDNPSQVISIQCNIIPDGYVTNNIDCNDGNENINPAQSEVACNGLDDDCDVDTSDNDSGQVVYLDRDGDGYGSMTSQLAFCGQIPVGYVEDNTDCNDDLALVNPDAAEICPADGGEGIDENCNGETDENCQTAVECPCTTGFLQTVGIDVRDPSLWTLPSYQCQLTNTTGIQTAVGQGNRWTIINPGAGYVTRNATNIVLWVVKRNTSSANSCVFYRYKPSFQGVIRNNLTDDEVIACKEVIKEVSNNFNSQLHPQFGCKLIP